jgi:proline dehydrogenase
MRPVRSALLRASTNRWLAERLPRWYFTRRAVRRFMPGEELDDALVAAGELAVAGVPTIITQLGENVATQAEVDAVVAHYEHAIEQVHAAGLDCHVSVKPTHLGLDLDRDICLDAHCRLARAARARGNMLWIDMESSAYTDATLDLFRALRHDDLRVGLCLQANLRRTAEDLAQLLPLEPSIRLVKGAYAEPADRAFARKRDVDAAYVQLAQQLLRTVAAEAGVVTGIATHDAGVIETIATSAAALGRARSDFELQMLYGIRTPLQRQLARDGFLVRVLISYGRQWFPWYMRRLAERPANVWFVARSVFAG